VKKYLIPESKLAKARNVSLRSVIETETYKLTLENFETNELKLFKEANN
jgi:hypothetical protein